MESSAGTCVWLDQYQTTNFSYQLTLYLFASNPRIQKVISILSKYFRLKPGMVSLDSCTSIGVLGPKYSFVCELFTTSLNQLTNFRLRTY